MRSYHALVALGVVALFVGAFSCLPALAATPSFSVAATGVTMSSNAASGTGSTSVTLTSVNGYAGTVGVICSPPTTAAGVNLPFCNAGGPAVVLIETLTANQTATGTIGFFNSLPPCNPCPVNLPRRGGHRLPSGLALAGALLVGLGFRRRAPRWLALTLFAAGSLAGLAGIGACGGNSNNRIVTPGTYTYTLSAEEMDNTNASASVTTSVMVTVP
jgi:hypothetical protein